MAEPRRYSAANQSDIQQILFEAQHRWLRPPEICEILQNYQTFQISAEPPTMPPSGSLFLFDRKVLRYFRKDGHYWRKKKDGKTVKEAHERLKAGSIDVLHCYYAHGEENENFQRRSYWMLEEELSHIVLVHYRDVKGNRAYFNRIQKAEETIPCSQETGEILSNEVDSSASCSVHQNDYCMHAQTTDTTSLNGTQTSEYEDAESVYNHQASSTFLSYHELQQPAVEKPRAGFSDPYYPASLSNDHQKRLYTTPGSDVSVIEADKCKDINRAGVTSMSRKSIDFQTWDDIWGSCGLGVEVLPFQASYTSTQQTNPMDDISRKEHEVLGQLLSCSSCAGQDFSSQQQAMEKFRHPLDQKLDSEFVFDTTSRFHEQGELKQDAVGDVAVDGKSVYSSAMKQRLLDGPLGEEGLKKLDSFNRWMSKELGGVNELADANESYVHSNSDAYWETVERENGVDDTNSKRNLDGYIMSPSLSQDQLFSIIDFSPSWNYIGCDVKVLITGRFLKSREEAENCPWSCMFGEVEVQAEIIADGILRCVAPMHEAGRVPFYVTCSNRLACSEVREFEYRVGQIQDFDKPADSDSSIENLQTRFVNLLCSSSVFSNSDASNECDVSRLRSTISLLLKENTNDWDQMLKVNNSGNEFSPEEMKDQLLEKLLKEKLHSWLLQKASEGGKGPNVLDEAGQGVLHFAAALGYDWALEPTIIAGVSVNFRDVNGWTALHWAAFCGRERIVGSLIALGAAPGVLTDPTPNYPSGSTPADLASVNGHKGIAGYLAESALRDHLSLLNLNEQGGDDAESSLVKAAPQNVDVTYGSSLEDSLAAVCSATQAAARIHQVFRVQSFQRKQIKELDDDKFGMSSERALSLVAVKTRRAGGHSDESVHAAAIRIQNKFRGYKGRKEYLKTRQRIIKIQAHVRGYQVRKNYRKIIWSVGIVEKIILRWRRKGTGLRGFKSEALTDKMQDTSTKEDDYDFFKEGRKQTEQRLQKALARVKSMVRYPEARDQYCRLLNVVNEIQETKVEKVLTGSEEKTYLEDDDLMLDLDALLDDETFMPMAS